MLANPPNGRYKRALLLSGGIGDFVHYISRISHYVAAESLSADDVLVFVEATNPRNVERLFQASLPEFTVYFLPRRLHWTITNPLLSVTRRMDRLNRAAYRYVQMQRIGAIDDWFLPFLCDGYESSVQRFSAIRRLAPRLKEEAVFVSARDKGALWWPTEAAYNVIRDAIPRSCSMTLIGSEQEKPEWANGLLTTSDAFDALILASAARLFIGSDTGFATFRELHNLPNIYCVDRYWFKELMIKYKYWNPKARSMSRSVFAFSDAELERAVRSSFADGAQPPQLAPVR